MLDAMLADVQRVLKPGGHCYIFFALVIDLETGIIHQTIDKYLGRQKHPIIWAKNTHSNRDPYKRFALVYEGIYFCWKGTVPRDLNSACHCVFQIPVDTKNKQHPSQKPAELYEKLISLSTFEGELVLDPTAGSGMSIATAVSLNRRGIGIEMDQDWYNLMVENVQKGTERIV